MGVGDDWGQVRSSRTVVLDVETLSGSGDGRREDSDENGGMTDQFRSKTKRRVRETYTVSKPDRPGAGVETVICNGKIQGNEVRISESNDD